MVLTSRWWLGQLLKLLLEAGAAVVRGDGATVSVDYSVGGGAVRLRLGFHGLKDLSLWP
jgi:hypothetical protein